MCGIAGWLGSFPDAPRQAARMAHSLRHRGPDGEGIRSWPTATLVHTRLSIIDQSPAGAQPMCNEDGTVWVVFNGEIYNHRDLRRTLEAGGHRFSGRSDSEVLPHLYEEEGPACVTRLRGMFALAIYDTRARRLVLARDRFGIKPLYYAPGVRHLAFASEVRPLVRLPGVEDRPNPQAIYDFTGLLYIPAPETFYQGVRALEPGQMLEGDLEPEGIRWKTRRYHCHSIAIDDRLTPVQASERAAALVDQAVQRQLESDVPLGTLLSGGIDSSLVSTAAQRASADPIATFNVRFPDQAFDETWAAQAVARHIGSVHTTLDLEGSGGTWTHITGLLRHTGQPFADTSLFAVQAVCRLMRRHVTVALSGDGGDEAFGGYNLFWQLSRLAALQSMPAPLLQGLARATGPLAACGLVPARIGPRLAELTGADDVGLIQTLFSWVRQEEQQQLCRDHSKLQPLRRWFEPQWEYHLPQRASHVERLSAYATEINTRLTLPNDFLFKVDAASMRESLEVRVPMLDEDLFDFGLSLPHRLKVRRRTCKLVLRGVADRWLPPEVARKPKWGFAIPMDTWADADFKTRLRVTLLGRNSPLPDFVRPQAYGPIVDAFCNGTPHPYVSRQGLYQRAIMLLSLHLALSRGTDEPPGSQSAA